MTTATKPNSTAKTLEAARKKFLDTLAKRITCPKCAKSRARDTFGVRLMNKAEVEAGEAKPVFRRQSYCNACRSDRAA